MRTWTSTGFSENPQEETEDTGAIRAEGALKKQHNAQKNGGNEHEQRSEETSETDQ